ncbi:MAG: tRNA (adenosine(37)-N6)-threonylcarbamoyltransferase complex dimerization subunit type 1 TsaB [Wenzhouxiangella sp.]
MNILAIETATPMCSVALQVGEQVLQRAELSPRGHANLLLPWIAELLAEAGLGYANLDRIAVGRGPGGFTSLRIGLSAAQGIALAHDLPMVPVSSLATLAESADPEARHARILALIDARMGEVFVGAFRRDADGLTLISPEAVMAPDRVGLPERGDWLIAGSGLAAYPELIEQGLADARVQAMPKAWPMARHMLAAAQKMPTVPAWAVEPMYVRDDVTS